LSIISANTKVMNCQKLDYLGHIYVADSASLASSSFT